MGTSHHSTAYIMAGSQLNEDPDNSTFKCNTCRVVIPRFSVQEKEKGYVLRDSLSLSGFFFYFVKILFHVSFPVPLPVLLHVSTSMQIVPPFFSSFFFFFSWTCILRKMRNVPFEDKDWNPVVYLIFTLLYFSFVRNTSLLLTDLQIIIYELL